MLAAGLVAYLHLDRPTPLPADAAGSLLFVSDREGQDALYIRRLPKGEPRRLVVTGEPVGDPALSPDGSRLAFVMGGRIGLVSLPRGEIRFVTLGVELAVAESATTIPFIAVVIQANEIPPVHE